MKLSSIPDKSANLLIDLKFAFNEYRLYKDDFILLTEILKYWKDHQKAFTLLTPYFYKEFLKIITLEYISNDNKKQENNPNNDKKTNETEIDYSNPNSDYIMKALIAQIINIAFENEECFFEFISPQLIEDNADISKLGEVQKNYTRIKIDKKNLSEYFKNIKGENTNKLVNAQFNNLQEKLKRLLNNLKREIEEYD